MTMTRRTCPAGHEADPAVTAHGEWLEAHEAYVKLLYMPRDVDELDDPALQAVTEAAHAAAYRLACTVPTTLAGVAALLALLPYVYGETRGLSEDVRDPDSFDVSGNWFCDDRGNALARSLRAGVAKLMDG